MIYLIVNDLHVKKHWEKMLYMYSLVTLSKEEQIEALHVSNDDIVLLFLDEYSDFTERFRKCLYLSSHPNEEDGTKLLKRGAFGYGNAYMSSSNFQMAIESITNDNIWVYPELMKHLIQNSNSRVQKANEKFESLSQKEKQVAVLICEGLTNQKIAKVLDISDQTVKTHIRSIYKKTDTNDRVSLALLVKNLK